MLLSGGWDDTEENDVATAGYRMTLYHNNAGNDAVVSSLTLHQKNVAIENQ